MASLPPCPDGEINYGPRPDYPKDKTILDLLKKQVDERAQSLALVVPEGEFIDGVRLEVNYAEMWRMVEQTGAELVRAHANMESKYVILVLPQGIQQVIAAWGSLRAGCGYVPIDAETQTPRLRILFQEVQATVAIGEVDAVPIATVAPEFRTPLGTFPKGAAKGLVVSDIKIPGTSGLPRFPTTEDRSLLFFSSGSTGTPKAIIYDHKWLMGCVYFTAQQLEVTSRSHTLMRCSYVWTVCLYDFFPANIVGGTLFIPPRGGDMNVQYMVETIARETIHALVIQPTLLNLLLDENANSATYPLRSLRNVVSSGEKLATSTAHTFVTSPGVNAKLHNMYGATEAGCTTFIIGPGEEDTLIPYGDSCPAGVPQPYVDVWVMVPTGDPEKPLEPVPTGEMGEIVFGGGGEGMLARGYWRNQELTEEKFLNTAFGRVYRMGDAGCWQDGQVVVKGRMDRQVKVRGVRIQPESIEAVLKGYTSSDGNQPIKASMVVPSMHEPIELTAFLQTGEGEFVDIAAVTAYLKQELGRVYVPKFIVHLPEGLPRTASGKPDGKQLQAMAASREEVVGSAAADQPILGDDAPQQGSGKTAPAISVLTKTSQVAGCGSAEMKWDVDLKGRIWKFTQDHKYRGEPIFPGSGFLALAAEACQELWTAWELTDLTLSKPLPLIPPRPMQVIASPKETGVRIRIASLRAPGEEWTTHCECTGFPIESCKSSFPVSKPTGNLSEIPVNDFYAQLADGGFDYGPQFKALHAVCHGGGEAGGEVVHREGSPFIIDPVDIDACFQLAPIVSRFGYQGAPVAVKRVEYLSAFPVGAAVLQVNLSESAEGIDFTIAHEGSAICVLKGLQLQVFDTSAPELLRLVPATYAPSVKVSSAPEVVAIGTQAHASAQTLAEQLGAEKARLWKPGEPLKVLDALVSIALVVGRDMDQEQITALEAQLPSLGFDLPFGGRVWLVVVGESMDWECYGRTWAAKYPYLMLSTLRIAESELTGSGARALLDSEAPPCITSDRYWRVEQLPSGLKASPQSFAGLNLDNGPIAVLSAEATPLAKHIIAALKEKHVEATLILPGMSGDSTAGVNVVVLCAVSPGSVAGFESLCANALQCLTLCTVDAFLPSTHSSRAADAAQAAASSMQRAQSGHKSWVVFAPPLMDGLWFDPPAPAGFHRCPVETFVAALADAPAVDAIVGLSDAVPKHWRNVLDASGSAGKNGRSSVELQEFLQAELASTLGVEAGTIDMSRGLEDLGVGSLNMLKLSQKLRRFVGRNLGAFALQGNPSIEGLVQTLSAKGEKSVSKAKNGRIICLHGFRTSSTILTQQMAPLAPILQQLGYELVVPDGPHVSKGPAQGAAGLDDDDSFGWWLYDGEGTSHDDPPIGVEKSIEYLKSLGPIVAVIGFSQGGAMAAQIANMLNAKWALLFSPVYIPGYPAKCDIPTMVAFDPAEEVHPCTQKLLGELPTIPQKVQHDQGHRLPAGVDWYAPVAKFLEAQTEQLEASAIGAPHFQPPSRVPEASVQN